MSVYICIHRVTHTHEWNCWMVRSTFWVTAKLFSKVATPLTTTPAMYEGSNFSINSLMLVIAIYFRAILVDMKWYLIVCVCVCVCVFKDFIYLFLDTGEGREKERERNINVWLPLESPLQGTWPTTRVCALTRNQTCNPLICRRAPNPLSHTSEGSLWFCLAFS